MYQSTYFIEKITNTFADNLAAFGLAFVLNAIANGRSEIRMEDKGYAFVVVCEPAIQEEWVETCKFFVGAPLLVTIDSKETKKQGKVVKAIKGIKSKIADFPEADGVVVVDYEREKQIRSDFFKWRDGLTKEEKEKLRNGKTTSPISPHPHWDIFRAINTTSAIQSYNSVVGAWWNSQTSFTEFLKIFLAMVSSYPNDITQTRKSLAKFCKENKIANTGNVTATQLLNPSQGKGTNSRKTEWSEPNQEDNLWLLEWLKVVGLYYGSISRVVANPKDPQKAKDRKTYVINPMILSWKDHQRVMRDFRQAIVRNEPPVKLDILTALIYTQAFLEYYEDARAENLELEIFGRSPADLVSGMQMAFYKSMNKALVMLNLAQVNLPRWVVPSKPDDLIDFQESIREHISVIRGLNEAGESKNKNFSDQYSLLLLYRDFLSANNLEIFLEFTTAYSGFVMSQKERRQFVRQFSIPTLEVLFMNSEDKKYSEIMQNEGFRNIAYAIRHSTVSLQNAKKFRKPATDIRYGLGQQLARKAAYPDDFLAELGEFLHLYNAENAQLREKNRNPFRSDVRMADLEEIVKLVDRFGSKVVCNMLVAFGYATEARSKDKTESIEQEVDDSQTDVEETGDEE